MNKNDISKNLTEPFSIEELIDRKKKNLEAIFDAVPVCLLLVDENFIVVRVNDTTRKLINKDYSLIINHSPGEALDCTTTTAEKKPCTAGILCQTCPLRLNIQKVLRTAEPVHEFEFQSTTHFQNKQQPVWFSMSIEPVFIEGKRHAVVCLHNITKRKLAEVKLVETIEMKSQFISTVSHDLCTPLVAIKEGIDLVLDGIAGSVRSKQKKFLEIAARNAERLNLLVNDVLNLKRLESDIMRFDFCSHYVSDVIYQATDMMTLLAKKNKINLTVQIDPDTGEAVFDYNRITQVLINLLGNALKFTPKGGRVSVRAVRHQNEIVITLSDTGIGIPKEELGRIFERFYRVKRTDSRVHGTGLGLAIAAQIVRRHNGRISVESKLDKGTVFTICLPVEQTQGKPESDIAADRTIEDITAGQ